MIVMAILPFVVYLAMYNCGLSQELWYSDNDIIGDFYCYYKSRVFIFTSVIAGIILLIRILVYKGMDKQWKPFILLAAYLILADISSIVTVNTKDTYVGSMYHFESIFVLAGYVIILLYAYVFVEKGEDFESVGKVFTCSVMILALLGMLQAVNLDIFDWEPFIRLITPQDWESYALEYMEDAFTGNNVSLTLYNPNNAGQYIAMILPYFILTALYGGGRTKKAIYSVLSAVLLILLWFTYSRGALVAFGLEILVGFFLISQKNQQKFIKNAKFFVIFVAVCGIIFVVLDSTQDFKFFNRLVDEKSHTQLKEIITSKENIQVTYGNMEFETGFSDNKGNVFIKCDDKDISKYYEKVQGTIDYSGFENISINVLKTETQQILFLVIEEINFSFVYEDGKYLYVNDMGKKDSLVSIPSVNFHGLETKGSGRLYLWSRTIPLLKNYIIIGSGPDTFYRVFPQNDYVGKKVYTGTCARMMEKPHNGYLMVMVQTGIISLICIVVFYFWYFKTVISQIGCVELQKEWVIMGNAFFIGTIGYVVSSFFYDSSLQCTPLFCVMVGISLSAAMKHKKDVNKNYK